MFSMPSLELVIERGQARCPYCVATAEYRFIERERNLIRYEVHCHRCDGRYREKLGVAVPNLPVLADPWLPAEQVAAVPVGERLRAALVAGRDRTVALAGTAAVAIKALEAPPWLTGVLARAQRP